MIQAINFSDFQDAFRNMNRQENFTYEAKQALFDYLEDLEESLGKQIELDVIALCCEWSEYEDIEALEAAYSLDYEELQERTTVIDIEGGSFLILDF